MKTIFKSDWVKLREICVNNDFYTCGTNDEYTEMFHIFGLVDAAETFDEVTNILERVARDILDHSDEENYILYSDYKDNKKELMSIILEEAVAMWYD